MEKTLKYVMSWWNMFLNFFGFYFTKMIFFLCFIQRCENLVLLVPNRKRAIIIGSFILRKNYVFLVFYSKLSFRFSNYCLRFDMYPPGLRIWLWIINSYLNNSSLYYLILSKPNTLMTVNAFIHKHNPQFRSVNS